MFYNPGLCCTIVGKFAMFIGGKLAPHHELISMYIAYHPQMLCPEISTLFQICLIPAFSFNKLDFLFMPTYSRPGSYVFTVSGMVM